MTKINHVGSPGDTRIRTVRPGGDGGGRNEKNVTNVPRECEWVSEKGNAPLSPTKSCSPRKRQVKPQSNVTGKSWVLHTHTLLATESEYSLPYIYFLHCKLGVSH